jgi:hypothetical protein
VEELAAKLEIADDLLLKHVSLWVNHGLVSFASGRKELVASTSFQDTRCNDDSMVEELETAVSSDAQAEEDFKVLETYIVGMLSNFGSLTIQRIHNMLSTFARSGAQPCTSPASSSNDMAAVCSYMCIVAIMQTPRRSRGFPWCSASWWTRASSSSSVGNTSSPSSWLPGPLVLRTRRDSTCTCGPLRRTSSRSASASSSPA